MSGCLDSIQCECGIDLADKRNAISSVFSGILFFTGWWVIIALAAYGLSDSDFNKAYYICGVVGSLAMFMVNAVSNSQVRGEAMTTGVIGTKGARLWLLAGFVLGFGALIASIWILFQGYVVPGKAKQWPGVMLFVQNFLIFIASLVYKFGRTEDLWG